MGKRDKAGTARSTVLVDNERVRATEWRFAERDDNTGWHRHEYDYVVVPLTDGPLTIHEPGGERRIIELKFGQPYFRSRGVEHDVASDSDTEIVFFEIELLL